MVLPGALVEVLLNTLEAALPLALPAGHQTEQAVTLQAVLAVGLLPKLEVMIVLMGVL